MGFFLKRRFLRECRMGNLKTVKQLLDKGADVNARDSVYDCPAICIAAIFNTSNERHSIVQLLIDRGADVNAHFGGGITLLMLYASGDAAGILQNLVSRGAHVNHIDGSGNNALMWALRGAEIKSAEFLIKNGADVNVKNSLGWTPLHRAAKEGWEDIVKLLLEYGANPHARNEKGHCPEDVARTEGHNGVADILCGKTTPPVPPQPASGWNLTATDEVTFTAEKTGIGYSITRIFNFNADERLYTQISRNMQTGAESQTMRLFDEFSDKKMLETAYEELSRLGGKADKSVIYGTTLDKPRMKHFQTP